MKRGEDTAVKRILFASDSFKGTLSAQEVCSIQKEEFQIQFPQCEMVMLPMADGGEGLVEACLSLRPGQRITCTVTGPNWVPVESGYAILEDGTAVIEMAAAAGLPLVGDHRDPLTATTYGVGELLLHACGQPGVRQILLGLGGSATNDAGIGMAQALGWKFFDEKREEVPAKACYLNRIHHILPPEHPLPVPVTAACDVKNPLCGPMGATAVYGPQKGVTPEQVPILDGGLRHLSAILEQMLHREIGTIEGSGAAGGMGAGVLAFLNGNLKPGIELLLDMADFDRIVQGADCVITGEGKIDRQSLYGKVPSGVAKRCQKYGVPCIALCGSVGEGAEELYQIGVSAIFSAVSTCTDFSGVQKTCREDIRMLSRATARMIRTFQ